MPEFSQQHGRLTPYDSKIVTVGRRFNNCLVTVKGGQIEIVQAPRTVVFAGPVTFETTSLMAATGRLGGGVHLYADGHRWLVDFNQCHRAVMARTWGGKFKLFFGLGSVKGVKVGKQLQEEFVAAMGSQGASVERE